MSTDHTPGPWRLSRTRRYVMDGFGAPWVCEVTKRPEFEANARLIAAAPGMAAALEWVVDHLCEGFCKDFPDAATYDTDMDGDCSACRARSALAKAVTP